MGVIMNCTRYKCGIKLRYDLLKVTLMIYNGIGSQPKSAHSTYHVPHAFKISHENRSMKVDLLSKLFYLFIIFHGQV